MLLERVTRARATGLLVAAFVPLLLLDAATGLFSRYVADDFCTAATLLEHGFVGAQQFWYADWSGRFGFVLVIDTLESLGPWTAPLTPAALLTLWLAATAAALALFVRTLGWALALATVLVGSTLATAPNLWQSLYWQTGAITYLLPIILLTTYLVTIQRARSAWCAGQPAVAWIVVAAILVALAVGCSETAMALVVCALGLGLLGLIRFWSGPDRRLLLQAAGSTFIVALAAALVEALAPGNSVRIQFFSRPPLGLATAEALFFPFLAVATLLVSAPAFAVLAYGVSYLVARGSRICLANPTKARRLMMVAGYCALVATGAPAFYLGGGTPPARAEIISQFVIVATFMCCGLLDGLGQRQTLRRLRPPQRVAFALLGLVAVCLGPLHAATVAVAQLAAQRTYAVAMDTLDRRARAAAASGASELAVPSLPLPDGFALDAITDCAASYYGLSHITSAMPPAPTS